MTLFWILLMPLFGSVMALVAKPWARSYQALVVALFPALALALLVPLIPDVLAGEVIRYGFSWLPLLGLNFSLQLDGLSLLFTLLILGIGLLVILYARYYLSERDSMPRFYACLLLFMLAMLGIVLSGNLLQMWFFWELTSISSFLLISYWSHQPDARKGARMALTVTAAGGLALLAGILLIGQILGSYELSEILSQTATLQQHAAYPVVLLLVLLGAFTKSAQFPFHFWLPNAMAAPTPVSAYLHSATMVKAGIFLLARLYPLLSGTDLWFLTVTLTGLSTLLVGAYFALFQHDIKGLLAYSTRITLTTLVPPPPDLAFCKK
jgi:multicomponent K+:H+ antiporter subunit A